jgi:serine/threonine-protein phosphatase 2A regulatory subunit B''
MSELDEDSDGFLQPHVMPVLPIHVTLYLIGIYCYLDYCQEMEAYIRGLIPNLAQLRDMPSAFIQMYCRIAARKFFFFCDPHRRGNQSCSQIHQN